MIRIVVGLQGSGKTFWCVHQALRRFRRERCQIYSNMQSLKFPMAIKLTEPAMLGDVRSGIVLLDEVGVEFSSGFSRELTKDLVASFAQIRKRTCELWCTSQAFERVALVLREQVAEVVACNRVKGWIFHRTMTPDSFIAGKRLSARARGGIGVTRLDSREFCLYDTFEIVRGGNRRIVPFWGNDGICAALPARREAHGCEREIFGWNGNVRYVTKAAYECEAFLRSSGRLESLSRDDALFVIAEEVARLRWLRRFGLTAADVPATCTFDNPWFDSVEGAASWFGTERKAALVGK